MVDWNITAPADAASSPRTLDTITGNARLERIVVSAPRPFVLIGERELSVLRRGLTKDGWKRSLYLQSAEKRHGKYVGAGLLSVANRWLETPISIPERSGHFHHFFCDCGTQLTMPDDAHPRELYSCPACDKTYSGEKYDGAVRYELHNRLAGAALSLALVYGIEKDKEYADKAAEILLAYAKAYPGPHTGATTGGILYQSLDEAVWVIPLAQAYDVIYYSRSLTDNDKRLIEDGLFRPVAEGLRRVGIGGNWGSWHLSAVGVIGLAIKDADLVGYALESFKSQMENQLGEDGLWPESVHTYHFYPLTAFVHFAEGCCRAGIDIYNWEVRPGKSLKAMFSAPLEYMYPSFRLPAINDGWYDSFLPLDLYEVAYRRWNDPAFAWVLKRGYKFFELPLSREHKENPGRFARTSFYAFLFGRDLPGRGGVPALRSQDFPHIGICTLRDGDNVMATFDYGPYLGHGHLDKLAFTLYANDTVLVPDYGTPGYGSGILRYYQSTAAHNTLVVDGKSQQPSKERSLTGHYGGSFLQFAEAAARDCYPGVTQTRRLVMVGSACVVSDVVTSDQEHDYDWLIRCEGKPDMSGGEAPDSAGYVDPLIRLDRVWRVNGCYRNEWQCENGKLAFAIWAQPGEARVGLGTCPAETGQRTVSVLACRERARDACFLAALVPSAAGESAAIDRDGPVLRVTSGDRTDYVRLRGPGTTEAGVGLETDGEVAAVRISGGEVAAIALVRGSWVKWQGDMLIECPAVADFVEISFEDRSPAVRYHGDTAGVMKIRTNSRAMRVNGQRAAASNSHGQALLRLTPQMLIHGDAQSSR